MHPRLAELFDYIDREHDALRATYQGVPASRRAVRPSPGSWTVDEVIAHLTIVERRIGAVLGAAIAEARERGVPDETSTEPILDHVNAGRWHDRSRRITGTPAVDPRTQGASYSWDDYESARRETRQVLLGADGLALEQVHRPHVFFGPLNLYEWIGFLGGHAARHAAQIREIDAELTATHSASAATV
jgi:hypothetical protein